MLKTSKNLEISGGKKNHVFFFKFFENDFFSRKSATLLVLPIEEISL